MECRSCNQNWKKERQVSNTEKTWMCTWVLEVRDRLVCSYALYAREHWELPMGTVRNREGVSGLEVVLQWTSAVAFTRFRHVSPTLFLWANLVPLAPRSTVAHTYLAVWDLCAFPSVPTRGGECSFFAHLLVPWICRVMMWWCSAGIKPFLGTVVMLTSRSAASALIPNSAWGPAGFS